MSTLGAAKMWIVIPRWREFQHYKERDPKWIKDHRRQYDQEEYLGLTFHQRGVLQGIRHSYAASDGQLTDSTLTLTRRLGQRVSRRDLEALNHAGYIEYSASKPLALRYQDASPEEETETEIETEALGSSSVSVFQGRKEARPPARETANGTASDISHIREQIQQSLREAAQ